MTSGCNEWVQIKLCYAAIILWKTVPPTAPISKHYDRKNMFAWETMPFPVHAVTEWHIWVTLTVETNDMTFFLLRSLNSINP